MRGCSCSFQPRAAAGDSASALLVAVEGEHRQQRRHPAGGTVGYSWNVGPRSRQTRSGACVPPFVPFILKRQPRRASVFPTSNVHGFSQRCRQASSPEQQAQPKECQQAEAKAPNVVLEALQVCTARQQPHACTCAGRGGQAPGRGIQRAKVRETRCIGPAHCCALSTSKVGWHSQHLCTARGPPPHPPVSLLLSLMT